VFCLLITNQIVGPRRGNNIFEPISVPLLSLITMQTTTPHRLLLRPDKRALCETYVGKPLDSLRTPAFIVDRATFAENCTKMLRASKEWGARFRSHLKTHKVINLDLDNCRCDVHSVTYRPRRAPNYSSLPEKTMQTPLSFQP